MPSSCFVKSALRYSSVTMAESSEQTLSASFSLFFSSRSWARIALVASICFLTSSGWVLRACWLLSSVSRQVALLLRLCKSSWNWVVLPTACSMRACLWDSWPVRACHFWEIDASCSLTCSTAGSCCSDALVIAVAASVNFSYWGLRLSNSLRRI